MKRVVSGDPSVLKQHYEKKVHDLELEKQALQVQFLVMLLISMMFQLKCVSLNNVVFFIE